MLMWHVVHVTDVEACAPVSAKFVWLCAVNDAGDHAVVEWHDSHCCVNAVDAVCFGLTDVWKLFKWHCTQF